MSTIVVTIAHNMMITVITVIDVYDWARDTVGIVFAVVHSMSVLVEVSVVFTQTLIYGIGLGLSHGNRTVRNNILVAHVTLLHMLQNFVSCVELHHA